MIERIDYDGWRQRRPSYAAEGRLIGIGIACYVEGCGLGPYEGAKARLTNSGAVLVTLAAAPQGQGYETVYAQIAADAMGLDMRYIRVTTGDTGRIPFGQGTFASRITATAGPAVLQACQALRARIFTTAAIMLKIEADNFVFRGDRVCLARRRVDRGDAARGDAGRQRRQARHHAAPWRPRRTGDTGVLRARARGLR